MSAKTFFDRIAFLGLSGRILVGLGVASAFVALILRREVILTGAAVSLGLGLAIIFFREAFRLERKVGPEADEGALPKPWIQWLAGAAIAISAVLGIFFKGALFYVVAAIIIISIMVALVLGILTRHA